MELDTENVDAYKGISEIIGVSLSSDEIVNNVKKELEEKPDNAEFFYKTSGIYSRILRYMAFMYRYDWYVTPYVSDTNMKKEKI